MNKKIIAINKLGSSSTRGFSGRNSDYIYWHNTDPYTTNCLLESLLYRPRVDISRMGFGEVKEDLGKLIDYLKGFNGHIHDGIQHVTGESQEVIKEVLQVANGTLNTSIEQLEKLIGTIDSSSVKAVMGEVQGILQGVTSTIKDLPGHLSEASADISQFFIGASEQFGNIT
jgi:hypothetical protein